MVKKRTNRRISDLLVLDFINTGNGDSILVREMDGGRQRYALLVDCGHVNLLRDDHPDELDPRSRRIYAGDFLRKAGVETLDLLLLTHFHRDHAGGLGRVLEAVHVKELAATYFPPEGARVGIGAGLPKTARNALKCLDLYTRALTEHPGSVDRHTELTGERTVSLRLTEELRMEILFGDVSMYRRQKELYDRALAGDQDPYELIRWSKMMNNSSLRQRLFYHGKQIVLGGDLYAHMWDSDSAAPCDILKVPHHGSLSSTTRKLLEMLRPETAVVCAAARRPDEQPHPFTVALLQKYVKKLYFTDAVEIPGLVEPEFHESVRLEIP